MKSFFLFICGFLVLDATGLCQGSCSCCMAAVETPVVAKPSDPAIVSASCNMLVIKWKGSAGQTFVIGGTYLDPSGSTLPLQEAVSMLADFDNNYTAAIPVVAGSKVSWNVKAVQLIEGRMFSSYTLRAMQDYPIPDCNQPVVTGKAAAGAATATEQLVISNEKLAMYPNPVNDVLNIKLSSSYNGMIKLTVTDVSGKTVLVSVVEKQYADYYNHISVSSLKPGMYFMNIYLQNGKTITSKFLKN
ncbi:MAG: T9SS type A sorting domain-containing protein [Williamsia sp.]|nr:T9SS type A sorting domain-containing protein [Williamsia sp.]